MEIMQGGVPAPWVIQAFEARSEPIQRDLPSLFDTQGGRIDPNRIGQAFLSQASKSEVRFAWLTARSHCGFVKSDVALRTFA
jgi:hypothetical protein